MATSNKQVGVHRTGLPCMTGTCLVIATLFVRTGPCWHEPQRINQHLVSHEGLHQLLHRMHYIFVDGLPHSMLAAPRLKFLSSAQLN
jgi:hypothetical protein